LAKLNYSCQNSELSTDEAQAEDELAHVAAVDAWLAGSLKHAHASLVEIAGLFRVAYNALWKCTVTTLGSVTLTS